MKDSNTKKEDNKDDFFQNNFIILGIGAFLLITLLIIFLNLFKSAPKKAKKPMISFIPYIINE